MVETRMDPLSWLRKQLETADVDLLREMVRSFAQTLMSAEADALCGADYGERSDERQPPQRLSRPWLRYPMRHSRASGPQAQAGQLDWLLRGAGAGPSGLWWPSSASPTCAESLRGGSTAW